MPLGGTDIENPIALSRSSDDSVEHLFAQIPTTGMYEFWVRQFDNALGTGQDYAVAWWAAPANLVFPPGDYNGDQIVDAQDYDEWSANFGDPVSPGTGADGSGDGVVDAADYVVWRHNLGEGGGSSAPVPEPSAIMLFVSAILLGGLRGRRFVATCR